MCPAFTDPLRAPAKCAAARFRWNAYSKTAPKVYYEHGDFVAAPTVASTHLQVGPDGHERRPLDSRATLSFLNDDKPGPRSNADAIAASGSALHHVEAAPRACRGDVAKSNFPYDKDIVADLRAERESDRPDDAMCSLEAAMDQRGTRVAYGPSSRPAGVSPRTTKTVQLFVGQVPSAASNANVRSALRQAGVPCLSVEKICKGKSRAPTGGYWISVASGAEAVALAHKPVLMCKHYAWILHESLPPSPEACFLAERCKRAGIARTNFISVEERHATNPSRRIIEVTTRNPSHASTTSK